LEDTRRGLIKKFHAQLSRYGIDNDCKMEMLAAYGVGSSTELDTKDLVELCNHIEAGYNSKGAEMSAYRRRLMAAIGGWLRKMGKEGGADRIKAIACRAANCEDFNKIPKERLRSLYYAFSKKQKDLEMAEKLTAAMIEEITIMN